MPLNPLTLQRQAEIEEIIQNLQLSTGLFYPEDNLLDLIQAAIPDVKIVEHDFDGKLNIKGAIFKKSKDYPQPLIAVQSKQSKPSKTFALAHEFGHYLLGHNPRANYFIDDRTFDGSKAMQNEGEANFFAQILLMPKDKFEQLDQPFVTDEQLAARFGVTEGAIRVRREWLQRNGYWIQAAF